MITPHHIDGTIPTNLPVIACTGHRAVNSEHIPRLQRMWRACWGAAQPEFVVVTGGAMGWDTLVAEAAQEHGKFHVLAIPFDGFTKGWPTEWKTRFAQTWAKASVRVVVSQHGSKSAYHVRNHYMLQLCQQAPRLDYASKRPDGSVDAYWDGREQGGTWATIQEALRRGIPVGNHFPGMLPSVDSKLLLPAFDEGRLFA